MQSQYKASRDEIARIALRNYKECSEECSAYDMNIPHAIREWAKRERDRCVWRLGEPELNHWVAECGFEFEFFDGSPSENNFRFCPHCGGLLVESREAAT